MMRAQNLGGCVSSFPWLPDRIKVFLQPAVSWAVCHAIRSPFLFHSIIDIWGFVSYGAGTLMRRWVCSLQLLLALASTVFLRTHDHILLSRCYGSPNLEGQVPLFINPGTG
jgi:hypothetical protein